MLPIQISTKAEYYYVQSRGYEPLVDTLFFQLPIDLRIEIQNETFRSDQQFYYWFYSNHLTKTCEESGQPIYKSNACNRRNVFSAENCSHILTRGNYPEMRFDPRNANLLIKHFHTIWENGTTTEKQKLNIWHKNERIIKQLISDYQ